MPPCGLVGLVAGLLFFTAPATAAPTAALANVLRPEPTSTSRAHQPPQLLLYTFLFGDAAWQAPTLPLFFWSVGKAPDVAVVIIGDGAKPANITLPPNVQRVEMSMDEITTEVSEYVGVDLEKHWRSQGYLKNSERLQDSMAVMYGLGCEYRCIYPALHPDAVAGYKWMGWIDNDVVIGGAAFQTLIESLEGCSAGVIPTMNKNHGLNFPGSERRRGVDVFPNVDAESGDDVFPNLSFGPLTIFKVSSYHEVVAPALNGIRKTLLRDVFKIAGSVFFDEHGTPDTLIKGTPRRVVMPWYEPGDKALGQVFAHSMSGVLNNLTLAGKLVLPSQDANCPPSAQMAGNQVNDLGLDLSIILDGTGDVGILLGAPSANATRPQMKPGLFSHMHFRKSENVDRFFEFAHRLVQRGTSIELHLSDEPSPKHGLTALGLDQSSVSSDAALHWRSFLGR